MKIKTILLTALNYLVVAVLALMTVFMSCNKNNDEDMNDEDMNESDYSSDESEESDEPMSKEFLMFLESLETVDISEFDFDKQKSGDNDCQNIQSLFNALINSAEYLTDRQKHQKPDEGHNKPAQNGLAYVNGQLNGKKDISIRRLGFEHTCPYEFYGLDCSGLIEYIFNDINCTSELNKSANDQFSTILSWTEINTSVYNGNIIVDELEENDIDEYGLKSGDIIVHWDKNKEGILVASHIGLVINDGNTSGIIHSIGSGDKPCSVNSDKDHGPIISSLKPDDIKKYFACEGKARVLRIKPIIFEVVPDKLQFDDMGGSKGFEIKMSFPIEDVKISDSSTWLVARPVVLPQTCGDTTTYTYIVIVEENLSSNERNTQIVVSAKDNRIEEKSINVVQEGKKPMKFHMEADLKIDDVTKHYSSDVFAYHDKTAYIPEFRWKEWNWGIYWSSYFAFGYSATYEEADIENPNIWGWDNSIRIYLYTTPTRTPEIGEVREGTIDFMGYSMMWGNVGFGRHGGTFTLTRIE
jgi:hypothetical protein